MSTILIVDDDQMILRTVEYTLTGGGHNVILTSKPEEAAALAELHGVDAVVLDVIMPGRSGYEVLEDMRHNPKTARIPVLMLSSLAKTSDRVKGLRRGASEYVAKPFDPEELNLRLNRLLANTELNDVEFQGKLESISFAEVAQGFLRGDRHGVLEVVCGNIRGEIMIESGRVIAASFALLNGTQALLAMLGLKEGTFRFIHRPPDFEKTDSGVEISIQQAIFTYVWMEDELNRREEVNEDTLLWPALHDQTQPEIPTGWDALPLFLVSQEITNQPGVALKVILTRILAAPRAVQLAVGVLIENGHILCTSTIPDILPANTANLSDLEAAVARITNTARARGFGTEQIDILLAVESSTHGTLFELRQNIDASAIAGSGDSMSAAWGRGDAALLALRGPDGELVVNIVSVESKTACRKIKDRMSEYACAIILVADPAAISDLKWIVEWLDNAPTGHWGIFMTTRACISSEILAMLEVKNRWTYHAGLPSTFEELVDLAAAAATEDC